LLIIRIVEHPIQSVRHSWDRLGIDRSNLKIAYKDVFMRKCDYRYLALAAGISLLASTAALARDVSPAALDLNQINLALKNDPLNAQLHYKAALAYETTSVAGTERREVSKAAYAMALKADANYWPAQVQLGLMALEDQDAGLAQRHLVDAARLSPSEPVIFYALARAAYCNGELGLASAAYSRASQLRSPQTADDFITAAAINARSGARLEAEQYVQMLVRSGNTPPPMVLRAVSDGVSGLTTIEQPSQQSQAVEEPASNKMGMIDIIILRRDEGVNTTNGINLLEALTLQFGGSLLNSRWSNSRDRLTGTVTSSVRDITREITATLPAVTYSLNIANARDAWSTVQAQQALLIYDQQTSKVSLGSSLTYVTDGDLNSSSSTKDVGLKLEIRPEFRDNGVVNVVVSAALEDFVDSAAGTFRQSVQTERSTTDVTADLRFGQTILIASGENAINLRSDSKTPLLGNVPILGKLFSAERKGKTSTSLLILLTLRPRGSEQLPHADEVEREMFRIHKDKLLEDLDADIESRFKRFIPDHDSMSYKIENPARRGDTAYLSRTGVIATALR
jgi:hypothetical protein